MRGVASGARTWNCAGPEAASKPVPETLFSFRHYWDDPTPRSLRCTKAPCTSDHGRATRLAEREGALAATAA
eukprot:4107132-Alexandrium_andersonii.AAC.1